MRSVLDTIVQWCRRRDSGLIRAVDDYAFHRLAFLLAVGLAGCGTLPAQVDRPHSPALAPSADNPLVRVARESIVEPSPSGFRLLPLGLHSLDARIELIRRARSSLDVQ